MITMILFQVLITVICTTPFSAINLYSTINDNIETSLQSTSAIAVYNFSANICRLLNYFNPVIGFYIYTLTSCTFRIEMKHILGRFLVMTGLARYLSENIRRSLFEQDQTLTNNQSITLAKTRVAFVSTKNAKCLSKNQLGKKLSCHFVK